MKERLREQGGMLTSSLIVLIIIGGLLLIDRPANWVNIILLTLGLMGVVLTFLRVRVVIKASVAIFVTLLGGSSIFELGMKIDPSGRVGGLWGLLYFSFFFLSLGISYLFPSIYSRWSLVTISSVLSWGFGTIASSLPYLWAVPLGCFLGTIFFAIVYILPFEFKARKSPENLFDPKIMENAKKKLDKIGFAYTEFLEKEEGKGYILTWSYDQPSVAYILYPIVVDQPFGIIGRKKRQGISYKGNSINPWLQKTYWKISSNTMVGAGPLLVLWKTGYSSEKVKIIGMRSPDQRGEVPVGVIEKISKKVFSELEPYAGVLKPKQIQRYEEINEAKK